MINIQNFNNNECFKWCFVRFLYPADYDPRRITKADKLFGDELAFFKQKKSTVKIEDIYTTEKTNLSELMFVVMKTK